MSGRRRVAAALVVAGSTIFAVGAWPAGATSLPEAPPTGLFELPAETIDSLRTAVAGLAEPADALTTGRADLDLCADGIGRYFAHPDKIADNLLDPLDPEALVYADVDGTRRIVAVAWMTTAPAQVLGVPLHVDDDLGAWVLHAWVGIDNPAGLLADRNPTVTGCTDGATGATTTGEIATGSAPPGSASNAGPTTAPGDPATTTPPASAMSANGAPTIDDAGISSESMHLVVAPTVSDPEGDEVSVEVRVDGNAVADAGGVYTVEFDRAAVGLRHDASISISATDARGATTTASFEHAVEALDRVTVSPLTFALGNGAACFGSELTARLTGFVELRGPVIASVSLNEELRADRLSVELVPAQAVTVIAADRAPVSELSRFTVGDVNEVHDATSAGASTISAPIGSGRDCAGTLSYRISIEEA